MTPEIDWRRLRRSKYATSYSLVSSKVGLETETRAKGIEAVGSNGITMGGIVPGAGSRGRSSRAK
jgi:hypothetical protein